MGGQHQVVRWVATELLAASGGWQAAGTTAPAETGAAAVAGATEVTGGRNGQSGRPEGPWRRLASGRDRRAWQGAARLQAEVTGRVTAGGGVAERSHPTAGRRHLARVVVGMGWRAA